MPQSGTAMAQPPIPQPQPLELLQPPQPQEPPQPPQPQEPPQPPQPPQPQPPMGPIAPILPNPPTPTIPPMPPILSLQGALLENDIKTRGTHTAQLGRTSPLKRLFSDHVSPVFCGVLESVFLLPGPSGFWVRGMFPIIIPAMLPILNSHGEQTTRFVSSISALLITLLTRR